MNIELDIPDYSPDTGMSFVWEEGFEITAKVEDKAICVKANRSGLISLARHLLTLAQENVPSGNHFHLDDLNGLKDGSQELIVSKEGG